MVPGPNEHSKWQRDNTLCESCYAEWLEAPLARQPSVRGRADVDSDDTNERRVSAGDRAARIARRRQLQEQKQQKQQQQQQHALSNGVSATTSSTNTAVPGAVIAALSVPSGEKDDESSEDVPLSVVAKALAPTLQGKPPQINTALPNGNTAAHNNDSTNDVNLSLTIPNGTTSNAIKVAAVDMSLAAVPPPPLPLNVAKMPLQPNNPTPMVQSTTTIEASKQPPQQQPQQQSATQIPTREQSTSSSHAEKSPSPDISDTTICLSPQATLAAVKAQRRVFAEPFQPHSNVPLAELVAMHAPLPPLPPANDTQLDWCVDRVRSAAAKLAVRVTAKPGAIGSNVARVAAPFGASLCCALCGLPNNDDVTVGRSTFEGTCARFAPATGRTMFDNDPSCIVDGIQYLLGFFLFSFIFLFFIFF